MVCLLWANGLEAQLLVRPVQDLWDTMEVKVDLNMTGQALNLDIWVFHQYTQSRESFRSLV